MVSRKTTIFALVAFMAVSMVYVPAKADGLVSESILTSEDLCSIAKFSVVCASLAIPKNIIELGLDAKADFAGILMVEPSLFTKAFCMATFVPAAFLHDFCYYVKAFGLEAIKQALLSRAA